MDTLFLTLMLMSILCAVLATLAAGELIWARVMESDWYQDLAPGSIPLFLVSIGAIIGFGAFCAILLFCILHVLGWLGLTATILLGVGVFYAGKYVSNREPLINDMARRIEP